MLDPDTRAAVLRLRREGHGTRTIADALNISRHAVKRILQHGEPTVPRVERETAVPREPRRVHEELTREGVVGAYATLTRFCRAQEIGVAPRKCVGTWDFQPGEEMQHDTSPHTVEIAGRRRVVQCASLVLCHSRLRFCQVYPTFNRFYCKAVLTAALQFFGGAARRCMIDNTHVVLAGGSGKNAIVAPEMEAFARRFGFAFEAHAIGYAERSARVERSFHEVENNFFPGRTFGSLADCNAQLRAWCGTKSGAHRRHLHASPVELFAAEQPVLLPLPLHVPEVVDVLQRTVDTAGEVHVETNRYSVPERLIGLRVEVLASLERILVVHRHEVVADHARVEDGAEERVRDPAHRTLTRRALRREPTCEAKVLAKAGPEFTSMVELVRRTRQGRAVQADRRLHRMYVDYPTEVVRDVFVVAVYHGLADLERVERMVLRRLGTEFFRLPTTPEDDDG